MALLINMLPRSHLRPCENCGTAAPGRKGPNSPENLRRCAFSALAAIQANFKYKRGNRFIRMEKTQQDRSAVPGFFKLYSQPLSGSGEPVGIQASGENWKEKRSTPDIALWDKLLDFATRPSRGLSIPFVLLAKDFRRTANVENRALVLDRHRLSAPSGTTRKSWLSKALTRDLNNWTQARLEAIANVRAS
jgi:hypothetical protein